MCSRRSGRTCGNTCKLALARVRVSRRCQCSLQQRAHDLLTVGRHAVRSVDRFDVNGYIVIPGVLSEEQCDAANAAIDRQIGSDRYPNIRPGAKRGDTAGTENSILGFPGEDSRPFKQMLAHPTIVPYLNALLGQGWRLDHAPLLLTQGTGSGPHPGQANLHRVGGADANFDPHAYYQHSRGHMYSGLTVVAWQLVDIPEGAGGLAVRWRLDSSLWICVVASATSGMHTGGIWTCSTRYASLNDDHCTTLEPLPYIHELTLDCHACFQVIPGTHKANRPCPQSILRLERYQEHVKQVVCKKGDVIIFTEVLQHGVVLLQAHCTCIILAKSG